MIIALSEVAYARYWVRVTGIVPEARPVRLQEGGEWIGGDPTTATVAWFTDDIFDAPLPRKFFGAIVRAPGLEWFQSAAAGHDEPVYERIRSAGARLTSAHVNAVPIAEHVVRAVIDHRHGAGRWRAAARAHTWDDRPHDEVNGTVWAVVGLGSIGRAVARLGHALGVEVRGVRRRPSPDDPVPAVTPDRMHEAIGGADVVVLCTPLTAETATIADDAFFAAMAPGSLFVNVGRGRLVDEEALVRGLDRGTPGAAALDVFVTEPLPPDHPFWDDERITVTPHVAGASTGNADRLADLFCANLQAFVSGTPLAHEVR